MGSLSTQGGWQKGLAHPWVARQRWIAAKTGADPPCSQQGHAAVCLPHAQHLLLRKQEMMARSSLPVRLLLLRRCDALLCLRPALQPLSAYPARTLQGLPTGARCA